MAGTFDGIGVITNTSKEFCVVALTINGDPRLFLFSKTIFYTFKVQCEGSMTNLLEEGMDVELCYRISHPGDKPRIIAVWLGDKPDIASADETAPSALYDRNCRILTSVGSGKFLARDEDNHEILISKDVVFRDGIKENVDVAENITLDAVPLEVNDDSGASYEATCAWMGPKPKMVDRFGLRFLDCRASFFGEEMAEGTVAVIPNDVVALVDVESVSIRVLVFRASFIERCERIQDAVDVGDRLCLRLGYGHIFCGTRQWYAKTAFKPSVEIIDVNTLERFSEQEPVERSKVTPIDNVPEKSSFRFGTNPEVLYKRSGLSGFISPLSNDNQACIVFENSMILVDRENFYVDRQSCSLKDFKSYVAPGNNSVHFDAISTDLSCQNVDGITHEATCAWIPRGKRMCVSDITATLPPLKMALPNEEGEVFYGIVYKFLLPNVALALIPSEATTVIIHITNFNAPSQYPPESHSERKFITNYVKMKEYVQFKVRKDEKHSNVLQAYDVKPAVFTEETRAFINSGGNVPRGPCLTNNTSLVKNASPKNITSQTKSNAIASVHMPSAISATLTSSVPSTSTKPEAVTTTCEPSLPSASVWGITPFKRKRLSQGIGFLLNCEGRLKVAEIGKDTAVWIEHIFGKSFVSGIDLYLGSFISLTSKAILSHHDCTVRFDAEFAMSPKSNCDFRVLRMWRSESVRPQSEHLLISELATERGFPNAHIWDQYKSKHLLVSELAKSEKGTSGYPFGKITSIPFHDCAVAVVESVPVLVTLESLQTDEEIDLKTASIETYLSIGDSILARYEKRSFDGKFYFRAMECYSFTEPSRGSKLQTILTRTPTTRTDIWGRGEIYRKEPIVFKDGEYFVEFVSSKLAQIALSSKLFDKGKVFIDGNVATPEMLKKYVGCDVTFHLNHVHSSKLPLSDRGVRVVCAWIGDEPTPRDVLKEIAAVPKGLVCQAWRYDAVVDSFPLPSHALCYIGYVPVLVQIVNLNGEEVIPDLKLGDRISISVSEKPVGDSVMVLSNDLRNLKRYSLVHVKDVYRNLTGTVTVLPEPVGKIKVAGANFEVSFELCHMRKFGVGPKKSWLASLKEKITIGKQVYVSAGKSVSNVKNVPYRAFEVYFIE